MRFVDRHFRQVGFGFLRVRHRQPSQPSGFSALSLRSTTWLYSELVDKLWA